MKDLTNDQTASLIEGLEAELRFFRLASSALLVAVLLQALCLAIVIGQGG